MQFASALVEYLVAGVAALLWVSPLLQKLLSLNVSLNEASAVLILPIAYALGLYIDSTSSFLIRVLRLRRFRPPSLLRQLSDCIFGKPYSGTYERTMLILSKSPELLAQTMLTYVGRDRIARCMALNSAAGIFVACYVRPGDLILIAFILSTFIWSVATWHRLERLSSKFKDQAVSTLNAN